MEKASRIFEHRRESANELIRINEALKLEIESNEQAHLHLDSVSETSLRTKFSLLRNGLLKIAQLLKTDPRSGSISTIHATSWIVTERPGLMERLGFTIENDSPDANKQIRLYKTEVEKGARIPADKKGVKASHAHIAREKFLELYG